ncbi:uncharacterized protein IL334_003447 [Kwoniella shivajii]|uniref:A1 cistron-splicing factor AAR2 n=1 Tax=Kwoniella shivajii TaxID=564305 RepID=A0ABZ1CXK6_9TREE|nr:hypothetical protein IL334_003447 [Kwoniella shivajii]
MNQLTPAQGKTLWEAGGFVVLTDLPEGSEFGIDGVFNVIRKFSGIKFLPPGLHLITWSSIPSSSSTSSSSSSSSVTVSSPQGGVPIRNGLIRFFSPRQRVLLRYDPSSEEVNDVKGEITDDKLRSIDVELAPYPFDHHPQWKSLTSCITQETVDTVLGEDGKRIGRVDGMTNVIGEEEDSKEMKIELTNLPSKYKSQDGLNFVRFNLRRSWRSGAIGEEVTKFSKDKSWLLGDVITNQLGGNPTKLISQLQLSFILLLNLSSYSALLVYKRILNLLCQSPTFISSPDTYLDTSTSSSSSPKHVQNTYRALIDTLAAQISSIPEGTFDTELPELDVFYLDQIETVKRSLAIAMWGLNGTQKWDEMIKKDMQVSWGKLEESSKKWGWEIGDLTISSSGFNGEEEDGDNEEEEEGEYAPVIVEI